MRPKTADELYERIVTGIESHGTSDLRPIAGDLNEFFRRFPEDSRAAHLTEYRDELEVQRMLRQSRVKTKFDVADEARPIEQVFSRALAISKEDPAAAIDRLEALLALYDPLNVTHPDASDESSAVVSGLSDSERKWLVVVRRELRKLHSRSQKQAGGQLPSLRERLAAAIELEETQPNAARRMYQAIVDLYGGRPWAQPIVDQARRRLDDQPKSNQP